MSEKKIVDTLLNIDSKILYIILMVLTLIGLIFTPGIAVQTSDKLLEFYDIIENLPPESIVVIDNSLGAGRAADMTAGFPAWVHLWKSDIKIIIFHFNAEAPLVSNMIINMMPDSVRNLKEYGTDWVLFGYAPGDETAQAAVCSDIRSVYQNDFYNTPIEELPLMKEIRNAEDFSLVFVQIVSFDFIESAIRQYGSTYGIPIIFPAQVGRVRYLTPYYPTQIKAYVTEIDAPSYEKMVGVSGDGLKLHDARALGSLYLTLLIVGANVLTLIKRREP